MSPKELVQLWIIAFNNADADALACLYSENAINHQMPESPVTGRSNIASMFRKEFSEFNMHCIPIQIIGEGNWAVLEWKDPRNFMGCGFFEVLNDLIHTQRGYWDKLSFKKLYQIK